MGSPKALLPFRGATFLDTLIELFRARCSPVIVVLGAAAEEILAGTRLRRGDRTEAYRTVINESYLSGQTSSMQCGLRAVPADADGILFTLVDHPAVSPATIDALLQPPLPLIRVPRFAGERGHPVWFRREMAAEFLALPPDGAANSVVRAHRAQTEFVDVDDPGVVADIDDATAYRELLSSAKERA
jgi:molybdenum cofactor cytidylyltransferase